MKEKNFLDIKVGELMEMSLKDAGNLPVSAKKRFSNVRELNRNQIDILPELFQGRQHPYSEETVNKIISEGFDKSNEPIVVWYNKKTDKYIVISGHSRWEASIRLYKSGDKSLKTMPVKEFLGDKDEAVSYAVLESNRASTQEGFLSDINAVRKMMKDGYNKTEMLKYIKPKSYLEKVVNYTYLNPNGRFIEYLDSPSKVSFPYLERNAEWVGVMRKSYDKKLTDSHESEIFDYLYKSGSDKGLRVKKDQFFDLIDKKVMTMDWNPGKPLNLHNIVNTSAITAPARSKIKELQTDIDYFKAEIEKKQDLIVIARNEGKDELIPTFEKYISDAQRKIISLKELIYKLEYDVKHEERTTTKDLFTVIDEPVRKPEVVKEKPKKLTLYAQRKPLTKKEPIVYVKLIPDVKNNVMVGYQMYYPANSNKKVAYYKTDDFQEKIDEGFYTIVKKPESMKAGGKIADKLNCESIIF